MTNWIVGIRVVELLRLLGREAETGRGQSHVLGVVTVQECGEWRPILKRHPWFTKPSTLEAKLKLDEHAGKISVCGEDMVVVMKRVPCLGKVGMNKTTSSLCSLRAHVLLYDPPHLHIHTTTGWKNQKYRNCCTAATDGWCTQKGLNGQADGLSVSKTL